MRAELYHEYMNDNTLKSNRSYWEIIKIKSYDSDTWESCKIY